MSAAEKDKNGRHKTEPPCGSLIPKANRVHSLPFFFPVFLAYPLSGFPSGSNSSSWDDYPQAKVTQSTNRFLTGKACRMMLP
jgi:hypothetical protein